MSLEEYNTFVSYLNTSCDLNCDKCIYRKLVYGEWECIVTAVKDIKDLLETDRR